MTYKVVDISKWNTISDWSSLSDSVDGLVIRCGYRGYSSGSINTDSKFASFATNATKYYIPFGVYFFSQATTEVEAREEAAYALDLTQSYKLYLPIFIDTEYSSSSDRTGRADSLTAATRTSCVKAFCDYIIDKGYEAGIYAADSWFNDNLIYSTIQDYNIWVAKYSSAKPKYVSDYIGWQYSSSGKVDGISGTCDLSYWYVTIPDIKPEVISNTTKLSEITAGAEVYLDEVPLYATASAAKASGTKSGIYYIWSASTANDRVRITNSKSSVGIIGQITGWIDTSEILTSSTVTAAPKLTSTSKSNELVKSYKLKRTPCYITSKIDKYTTTKTGTFYIYSPVIVNGRVRITDKEYKIGVKGQSKGWVKLSDLQN